MPSNGDRCDCRGQCGIHPDQCRETHGAEANWDKGFIALRPVRDVGNACDRCARTIERRRRNQNQDDGQGLLFGD